MTATRITARTYRRLLTRPVFVEGILQPTLRELTSHLDAEVNGVALRLPAGCVITLLGGGSGGVVGKLMTPLTFTDRGERWQATPGMDLLIPA